MAEKEIRTDGDEGDAQKKARGERRKKELTNPIRCSHPALTRLGIAGMAIGVRADADCTGSCAPRQRPAGVYHVTLHDAPTIGSL